MSYMLTPIPFGWVLDPAGWRGLTHFDNFIHIVFSDGNKFHDMSKVCCLSLAPNV